MSGALVFIDPSQFPGNVRRDLVQSLRDRSINQKFHYDSYKQASKWLALHDAYSPARNDPSCAGVYDEAFEALLKFMVSPSIHVIALGCGGGQKEARLLTMLRQSNREASYTASDVSLPLALTARSAALTIVSEQNCRAVVCDLATAECLASTVGSFEADKPRVITLFGVIPNFAPALLLSKVIPLLRPNDLLLMSANLSPGPNYAAGVQDVQPQYDNDLTRDWLATFLFDVGFERHDGDISFEIQTDRQRLHRIVAFYRLKQTRNIRVAGESFSFQEGDRIELFFSYRHTPQTIQSLMAEHRISVIAQWANSKADEGIFLCRSA